MEALRAEKESDLSDFHVLRQGFIPHRANFWAEYIFVRNPSPLTFHISPRSLNAV